MNFSLENFLTPECGIDGKAGKAERAGREDCPGRYWATCTPFCYNKLPQKNLEMTQFYYLRVLEVRCPK